MNLLQGGGPPTSLKDWQKSETGFRNLNLIFPHIFFSLLKVHVKWFEKNSFDSRKNGFCRHLSSCYLYTRVINSILEMDVIGFTNVLQLFFSSLKLFWLEIGYSCQVTLLRNT